MKDELFEEIKFELKKILTKKRGQFLLVGPDRALLEYFKDYIALNSSFKPVDVYKQLDENPKNKIFFINLEQTNKIEYQSLLYYYLELPMNQNCLICLISNKVTCLDYFEKRIKSRFQNNIFFIQYLNLKDPIDDFIDYLKPKELRKSNKKVKEKPTSKNVSISLRRNLPADNSKNRPNSCESLTILSRFNHSLIEKYGLSSYSLKHHFSFFNQIHLILLLISYKKPIKLKDCVLTFRKSVINLPEVKKVLDFEIFQSYLDILESNFINLSGSLMIDVLELAEYVFNSMPDYLKRYTKKMIS